MRFISALFLGILMAGATAHAQDSVRITSSFEPSIIHAGETSVFRFTVNKEIQGGGFMSLSGFDLNYQPPSPPSGMQMAYIGKSRQTQIINSQTTASVSEQFRVRAGDEGEYKLPAFSITVDGKDYTVPAATLKVLPKSQAAQSRQTDLMSMELVLPRDKIYVGESLPVQIHLYIRRDVQVARLGSQVPTKVGDAFAVSDFSDPIQRQTERNGEVYHEVIWQAVITPYKAGDYPLVFQEDVFAYAPDNSRNRTGDPFVDRFFSRMSMGNLQQIPLYTQQDDITVLDLPQAGRPDNFTGAIGLFRAGNVDIDPNKAEVGEPMTLSFNIEGSGNFARFEAPDLSQDKGWRVYTPEENFAPTDRYGYQGRKTYKYVIIPRSETVTATPEIAFNYFNPDTEKYEELTLPAQSVTITPPPPGQHPNIPPSGHTAGSESPSQSRQPELLPIKTTVVAWGQSMRPLLLSPWFMGAQVVPLIVLLALVITRRRHNRLLTDPRYAREVRARQMLKPRLTAARKAAQAGEHASFYTEAQRVIQSAVGRLVDQTSEALSASEIDHLLVERSVSPELRQTTQDFLNAGEALKFGGLQRSDIDLRQEMSRLESLSNQLMKLS